jgi:hypothetical protein
MRLSNASNGGLAQSRASLAGVAAAIAAIIFMVLGAAHAAGHGEEAPDALSECAVCTIVQTADQQAPREAVFAAPVAAPGEKLAAAVTPPPAARPVLTRRSRAPPALSPQP